MPGKFRAITQVFLIPLGPWDTKIKVLCFRILCIQNVPGSRSRPWHIDQETGSTCNIITLLLWKLHVHTWSRKCNVKILSGWKGYRDTLYIYQSQNHKGCENLPSCMFDELEEKISYENHVIDLGKLALWRHECRHNPLMDTQSERIFSFLSLMLYKLYLNTW